jgi:hypothetical protein
MVARNPFKGLDGDAGRGLSVGSRDVFPSSLPIATLRQTCPVNRDLGVLLIGGRIQMIPIPLRIESMTAAAITEPTWPPVLAPMACMRR